MNAVNKKYILIILAVCGAIFFSHLETIYVNIMEARNFITAREMLQYGHWLHTTMNLEPRYEKPPLPTWLTAISAAVFGMKSLFGLRLPAALSATFLIGTSYFLSDKILNNKKQALINALILATSFYIIFSGRNGQWDIFAHAFMMLAIYTFFIVFTSEEKRWKDWLLIGLFLGFSFMSKGPVSFFALLLPFLIAYGIVYKYNGFRKKWTPLLTSLILFAIVGLSWGIYIYFTDSHAAETIADKETLAWSNRNIRPWYYYWSFFTQSGLWTFFSFIALLYPFMIKRVADKKAYRFTFLWTVITVVLLSLIPEKKSRYLLPVLIPMALNTGFYIHYLIQKGKLIQKTDIYIATFGFGLIGLICVGFPFAGYFFLKNSLDGFWLPYIVTSAVLFSIGIILFQNLIHKNFERVFYATIAMMCAILLFGFPLAKTLYNNPGFNNISNLRNITAARNLPLYSYNGISPELIWELGEPAKVVTSTEKFPENEPFGLLVTEGIPEKFYQQYTIQALDTFDINYIHPSKKGYKKRLTAKFYVVSKK
ncbi:MAG TPA: phospholipid carrier-dependent glycosyltransferase [Flavobacteriia bacterium]|nr:phospholipid carrier-dependent glycosyltransferase [Flavobacteriia bacterium]